LFFTLQWVDVTGRAIDDIHDEMHRVAVDIVQSVGDREVGRLWTDDISDFRTNGGS